MHHSTLWPELLAYGSGISLSPIHIGLLLLLLLGPNPLRRGGLFVLSWMATITLMVVLLLTVGHQLLLTMEQGSSHRTVLDLLGAGALLALGLRELIERREEGSAPPGWTQQLDRLSAMPLPLLLGASCAIEAISPDDLFLLAKAASALLASGLSRLQEVLYTAGFSLAASLALLLPFLAVLVGRDQVLPLLERGKQLLFARGDLLVGGLSLALAVYLGWQGITGLQQGQAL
jgi:Sap, sulfolipid-1-addressing protein